MWQEKEDSFLEKFYTSKSKKEILEVLPNRSWEAIRQRANTKFGLKRRPVWTKEEIDFLRKFYKTGSKKEIMGGLTNRLSWKAIKIYANKNLKLSKRSRWRNEEIIYLKRHWNETKKALMTNLPDRSWVAIAIYINKLGLKRENKTLFQKDQEPWNKNLKGIHLSPESEFKKGFSPWNKDGHWTKEQRKQNNLSRLEHYRQGGTAWNKGIFALHTPLRKMLRNCSYHREWSKEIFKGDNYICQECYKRGGYLHAHHKRPFYILLKEFLEKYNQFSPLEDKEILFRLAERHDPFWDLSNGKTLCEKCHGLIWRESVKDAPNLSKFFRSKGVSKCSNMSK